MNQEFTTQPRVRVLFVDDSAFMRTALSRMIASEADFEVIATAFCGANALEKIVSLDPEVITLDIEMPGLDGLQTLPYIMNQFPRPVIMVSALTERGVNVRSTRSPPESLTTYLNTCRPVRSTSSILDKIS
jgi:chemotaxis response regulator CheB